MRGCAKQGGRQGTKQEPGTCQEAGPAFHQRALLPGQPCLGKNDWTRDGGGRLVGGRVTC